MNMNPPSPNSLREYNFDNLDFPGNASPSALPFISPVVYEYQFCFAKIQFNIFIKIFIFEIPLKEG